MANSKPQFMAIITTLLLLPLSQSFTPTATTTTIVVPNNPPSNLPTATAAPATAFDAFLAQTSQEYIMSTMSDMKATVGLDQELQTAESNKRVITVNKDGTGDFKTIQEAVDSIPVGRGRVEIQIGPGVYKEKVRIEKGRNYITLLGQKDNMPTITASGTAAKYGTWESATVGVDTKYFIASNIIFENSAPNPRMGARGGQAVALRISGDKAAFYNCQFLGYQDTLLDDKGRHLYQNCLIRGTEDFIFGNARSLYKNCVIESVSTEGLTSITAQGRTTKADFSGFSFVHCNISGTGEAYLSRAWRPGGRVVFSYTYMGPLIQSEGWDDKGVEKNQNTVYYGEFQCVGPGSSTGGRVKYGRILTPKQAQPFLSNAFIHGSTWLLPPPNM